MELCEVTQLFKKLPGQSLFTGYFSPLGPNPSGRQKEEVVVCTPGPGHCQDCPDLCGHRASQPLETVCHRRAALRALVPGCEGRPFYRFFFASFLGLLFAEGAVALGFLVTSALRGSDGSASASWDLGTGMMMASTQMSWKMAPRKSPYRSRFSRNVG